MEGRHPPPKAEHPYPNNPDVYKFWGAPWGRTVFRASLVAGAICASLIGLNNYVSWGHPNILGWQPLTQDEMKRKMELRKGKSGLYWFQLPVETVDRLGSNLQFDDGVKFLPGGDDSVVPRK